MEDEINLREYLEVLLKRWYWLVGIGFLGAIVAFAVSSVLPSLYEAEASVLILQSRTDVSFEPTIRDDQSGARSGSTARDEQLTLVNLGQSSEVASRVLEEFGDSLPPESRNVPTLLEKIEMTNRARLITIKVTDQDPLTAAQLADGWARVYENYINQLYNGRSSVLLGEVEQQAVDASTNYQEAQVDLETFLKSNQIAQLLLDIQDLDDKLATKYELLAQQYDVPHDTLADKYEESRRLEGWLEDAKTIQDQLNKSRATSANGFDALIALILLQNQISVNNTPLRLEINLADFTETPISPDDAANLIEVIEERRSRLEAGIERQAAELFDQSEISETTEQVLTGSESAEAVAPLIARKLELEGLLAGAEAQQRELEATRDLAWEHHQAMQRKLAEVKLDLQFTDSEVRVASLASIPERPVSPRRLLNTLLGGLLGITVAVVGVFIAAYWQVQEETSALSKTSANKTITPNP